MAAPDYATELADLRAGLASGAVTIEADGERLTYRSVADILKGIAYFEALAAAAGPAGANRAPNVTVAAFSRD